MNRITQLLSRLNADERLALFTTAVFLLLFLLDFLFLRLIQDPY